MIQTVYRPVPGIDDLYAGMDGTIVKSGTGRLEPKLYESGKYFTVCTGKVTSFVHTLVAAAFLGPRPEGMQVRHADGDRTNNTLGNLCYGTPKDNMQDAISHGTHCSLIHALKTHCKNGHEYTPENTYTVPGTDWRQCRTCRRSVEKRRRNREEARAENLEKKARRAAEAHDKQLAAEQRQEIINQLLSNPALSSRTIADMVGVTHTTVIRWRRNPIGKG